MGDADRPELVMSCTEMVELLTEYLEESLDPHDRERFDTHLGLCPGCVTYLDQFRRTIDLTGTLREEDVDPAVMDELMAGFADWKTERS